MKVSRHAKIIELISQYDIETQEELAEYLNNAGFKVTQATVSRDIRDLKLTKISVSGGRQKYVIHRQEEPEMNEKYIRVLRDGYVFYLSENEIWLTDRVPPEYLSVFCVEG